MWIPMSLPVNTSDIFLSPECLTMARTKSRSTKIANSMKSQGHFNHSLLANFYRCFIYDIPKSQSCLCILPQGYSWHFSDECHSAFSALKKAFTTAPSPYPLDPGHSNHSQDWCLWTMHSLLAFQLQLWWQLSPHCIHSWTFSALELNYDVHDKELLAIFEAFQSMWLPIIRICNTFQQPKSSCVNKHVGPNISLDLTSYPFPVLRNSEPNLTLTRWWDIYLKRGIVTMPVSIHRTTPSIHFWATACPSKLLPYQSSPLWISSWRLKGSIPTSGLNPRWSHFHRTPWQSVRPSVDPYPNGLLRHLRRIYVPNSGISDYVFSSTRTTIPLQDISVNKDSSSSPHVILLVRDFQSMSRTTENCAPLIPTPKPYRLLKQLLIPRSLEFHIHGIS